MGIITYVFHRSDTLTDQRFHTAFLDIGENIHIHYRDLRIELSVEEFEEFSRHFDTYRKGVAQAIAAGYRDGVLPNNSEPHTVKTFWNKKKLQWPVKYNSNTLSIEENTDGFHIHLRNYKLLLDKASFKTFAKAMSKALLLLDDRPPADPVALLQTNHLFPEVKSRRVFGDGEEIELAVQGQYFKEVTQVLIGLGYRKRPSEQSATVLFKGEIVISVLDADKHASTSAQVRHHAAPVIPLTDFIDHGIEQLDRDDLNRFKLKLLYLFKLAEQGKHTAFRLEDVLVNVDSLVPFVNLFGSAPSSAPHPRKEYERLSSILGLKKLFFVKPTKKRFLDSYQDKLVERLKAHVAQDIASHPCVNRVHLLGSSTKRQAGRYTVPFVHFDWVKTASDFDIMIELEPDHETGIPKHWKKHFFTKFNSSMYYHLGDIGDGMNSDLAKQYPGIVFFEHILEAYLYYPSVGDRAIKDKYLEDIGSEIVFERKGLLDWIETSFGVTVDNIKRFGAVSFNRVYDVKTGAGRYALKIYDHRYMNESGIEKIAYEMEIVEALKGAGLNVAQPRPNLEGEILSRHDDDHAVLFEFMKGAYHHRPDEQASRQAGALLAGVHKSTEKLDLSGKHSFDIRENVLFWLNTCQSYVDDKTIELPTMPSAYKTYVRELDLDKLHCHGDVSPRNFLFDDGTCGLIDFQNAGYGPALIDVADGAIEFALHSENFRRNNAAAFLSGYESVRPLSQEAHAEFRKLCATQALVKIARLLRAHHGFGHPLKTGQINGLKEGLAGYLEKEMNQADFPGGSLV